MASVSPPNASHKASVLTDVSANFGCKTYVSTDVPVGIDWNLAGTSTLTVPDDVTIADLNVVGLNGTHTWVGDIDFNLTSPAVAYTQILDVGS